MMADSPIAKYNQKEPDVVQVEEKFSDDQELSRIAISSSGNETAADAGTPLCNSYSLTDVPRRETKLESGNGSGFVSKVVESKSNCLPAHHHQVMTADFSELTALEKSNTSTPLVSEREHFSADDEKPSPDEKFDGMRYTSTLEKDDSRAISSQGFTHNITAAEASGEEPLPSKSCIDSLKENLKSFNSSAPSEQEFWRVEEQDMALKSGNSWVTSSGPRNNQKCLNCKQKNHTSNHCPYPEKIRVFQTCSDPSHNSKSCPFCMNCGQCKVSVIGQKERICSECQKLKALPGLCGICNQSQHKEKDCSEGGWRISATKGLTMARHLLSCYNCGGNGHLGIDCPKASKASSNQPSSSSSGNRNTKVSIRVPKNMPLPNVYAAREKILRLYEDVVVNVRSIETLPGRWLIEFTGNGQVSAKGKMQELLKIENDEDE